jgi:two-component system response regulator NreC
MDKIKIMLVDDHTVLRSGLKVLINRQADMEVIGEAGTGREMLQLVPKLHPEVVVLDLSMPGGPSLPMIEQLHKLDKKIRVMILSMHDDPAYVRAAMAAGAKGYVVKTISEADLLSAIRMVNRGRVFIDLDDEAKTAEVFQVHSRLNTPSTPKLSDREIEVLKFLGQGMTNQSIAEQLDISPKTVATYRARLADKLGLKTTAEYVKFAADNGYLGPQL